MEPRAPGPRRPARGTRGRRGRGLRRIGAGGYVAYPPAPQRLAERPRVVHAGDVRPELAREAVVAKLDRVAAAERLHRHQVRRLVTRGVDGPEARVQRDVVLVALEAAERGQQHGLSAALALNQAGGTAAVQPRRQEVLLVAAVEL